MRRTTKLTSADSALRRFRRGVRISFHADGREAWHQDTSTEVDFRHRLAQRPDEAVYVVEGYNPDELAQVFMDMFPLSQREVINGRVTTIRKVSRFNDALVINVGGEEFALSFDVRPY
jgi:hypothetical protein